MAETGSALLIKFKGFKNDDEWIDPVSNAVQAADRAKLIALAEAKVLAEAEETEAEAEETEAEAEAEDEGHVQLNKVRL